jgi:uncharacterized phage protein gp47/JayE
MPALFATNESIVFGDIIYNVVNGTNLTKTSPGSKIRAITQALAEKVAKQGQTFDLNVAQAFLDGANGQYLEFLGDMLNVRRLGANQAQVSDIDKNLRFYTSSGGTFGSLNSGSAITIPAGTIVSSGPSSSGIIYTTLYTVILAAGDTQTYIAAQSLRQGNNQNIGAGTLTYHNFINYTDLTNQSLLVTNDAEVTNGQDIETDTNYKYRISNAIVAGEAANATAIRLAVLSVPGVADTVIIPYFRGIGTVDILIKATVPTVSAALISAVTESVMTIQAQGELISVRGPQETGLSITGTLTLRRLLSDTDISNITTNVINNLTTYINSLDIGEPFIVNQAIDRVLSTSAEIKNIGTTTKPFDNMYLYKQTKLQDNKVRSNLINDYQPANDERVIVENVFAGATPLFFQTKY